MLPSIAKIDKTWKSPDAKKTTSVHDVKSLTVKFHVEEPAVAINGIICTSNATCKHPTEYEPTIGIPVTKVNSPGNVEIEIQQIFVLSALSKGLQKVQAIWNKDDLEVKENQ